MAGPVSLRRQRDPWPRQSPGIRAWWQDHRRVGGETLRAVSLQLGTSLLVWVLVGIALALPGGLFLVQQNLQAMTAEWQGRPGLSLYFTPGTDSAQVVAAAQDLERQPQVETVRVTSAAEALVEFEQQSGLGDALRVLEHNPLPASIRVVLRPDAGLAALTALGELAEGMPGMDEVVLEKTWLERMTELSRVVSRLGWALAGLFGLGAILVTATSVRLAIEARLDEIRVQKLAGATDRQIRRPFLYYGGAYGFGGGLLAAMLISALLLLLEAPLARLLGSFGQPLALVGFDALFFLALLGIGVVLGIAGALLAARRRLAAVDLT